MISNYSDAKQDIFVSTLFNHKKFGTFVDIGSCGIASNNSYMLEKSFGWKGICIERESGYNSQYLSRDCDYINADALTLDYTSLFNDFFDSFDIDYLSVDIDEASIDVLKLLPLSTYTFKIITIEHDYYLHKEKFRDQQRSYLNHHGYSLLFGNVYVEQPGFSQKECAFEDWWIKPEFFPDIVYLQRENIYPSQVINLLERAI